MKITTLKKRFIKVIGVIALVVVGTFSTSNVLAATFGTTHRGAWSNENFNIHYSGGVFFYSHYAKHMHAGYAKYSRGGKTITSNWTGYLPYPSRLPSIRQGTSYRQLLGFIRLE